MRPTTSPTEPSQPRNDVRPNRGGGRGGGRGRSRGSSRGDVRREWMPRASPVLTLDSDRNEHLFPANVGNSDVGPILPIPSNNSHHIGRSRHRPVRSYHGPRVTSAAESTMVSDVVLSLSSLSALSSSVPQLVQEIQDKLTKGGVECMICYDMVRRWAPIWSCTSCYSIFHLPCIKKWARSPTSTDTSSTEGIGNWRCPGCQSVQLTSATNLQYICFCGNRRDPPNDLYITPHSCGETCGKPLGRGGAGMMTEGEEICESLRCPHLCVLQCHPGPCPPCKAFAPRRSCPCGNQSIVRRCSDVKTPITCGNSCNRLLSCGRHRCKRICHTGPCDSCAVFIRASCFCKKKTEMVLCGEMSMKGEVLGTEGIFSCNSCCGKILNCGNHSCNDHCHPGPCGECDFLPHRVKTCYCGKMELKYDRNSCLDPIPTCSRVCGKLLQCGVHLCEEKCHEGGCKPCLVPVNQKCRCGSTSRMIECSKALDENDTFVCEKPCGRKKNCGRHRCNERCCPLSSNSTSDFSGDWDPHLCQMPCEKKLRCGQHSCQSLCHSGYCPPCLETIFSDLSCACGKTSIPPPLPCGTPYPSCPHPCSVPQPCGHPATHTCHFGDCPPCAVPVAKECVGGHVVLRNIPCGSRDIRCNQLCGKTRQCGLHACARTCHPSPCDPYPSQNCVPSVSLTIKASCGQTCGAPRRDCRHTCTSVCHPSSMCPDTRCEFHVTIKCSCGRISANVPCGAGSGSGGGGAGFNTDTVCEATIIQKLPVSLQALEVNGKRIPLGQRKLTCDEECAKLERKRVLADAFDVTTPNLDALHFGESTAVSDLLGDLLRREPKWVMALEERFKFLVLGKARGGSISSLKVHVFCPMTKDKRDVLRNMAERWKLAVYAAGWEPKRFIIVHSTPKSKAPARILGSRPGFPVTGAHSPVFDPLVDMDPRLVISFLDLPREADISALVLRFGGECEMVWLNDKNALAVFTDPARAATALRRLDHGSAYQGAAALPHISNATGPSGGNVWGRGKDLLPTAATVPSKGSSNPWKKVVSQESNSWGGAVASLPVWNVNEAPIPASMNQWTILESETVSNSTTVSAKAQDEDQSGLEAKGASSSAGVFLVTEEIDDWEKAYE